MELDIWQRALSYLITLWHNSVIWFWNFNSESIVTVSNFLWELTTRGITSVERISAFLVLSNIKNISDERDLNGTKLSWLSKLDVKLKKNSKKDIPKKKNLIIYLYKINTLKMKFYGFKFSRKITKSYNRLRKLDALCHISGSMLLEERKH